MSVNSISATTAAAYTPSSVDKKSKKEVTETTASKTPQDTAVVYEKSNASSTGKTSSKTSGSAKNSK